jgi:ribulose-bisphosphate carboxylase large chain
MKKLERKFEEYVALGEEIDPEKWIISYYYIEGAKGFSPLNVAAAIAAEESTGTWTVVTTETREILEAYGGKVIDLDGNHAKVAFPLEIFEPGNIPQLLSVVAGNLFGLKGVKNAKLLDIRLPEKYVRRFKGPKFGIKGVRKIVGTSKDRRPHIGTIVKPKLGLSPKRTAEVGYEAAVGGVDFIKDDETLTSTAFCPIEKRLTSMMRALEKVKRETGRTILYSVNVTHDPSEMVERAERMIELGANMIMMDVVCCGFSALKELAESKSITVPIHVHRAMHAAFTRNPKHGISMNVVAKLVRLAGGDQLHIGTVVGKMHGERPEVVATKNVCQMRRTGEVKHRILEQEWYGLKPVFAVHSGGLHPGLVPELIETVGSQDIVINFGGGIHGHPSGTRAGAAAARQAVDAFMKNIPLEEYAKTHPELQKALQRWGTFRPRA